MLTLNNNNTIRDNSNRIIEYDYDILVISTHWYISNIVICGTPFTSLYARKHNSKNSPLRSNRRDSSNSFRVMFHLANTHIHLNQQWSLRNNDIHYLLKSSTSLSMISIIFSAQSTLLERGVLFLRHNLQVSKDQSSKDLVIHRNEAHNTNMN
jgi:hypothetical protein